MHVDDPAMLVVPAPHGWHVVLEVAPTEVENVPAAHLNAARDVPTGQ